VTGPDRSDHVTVYGLAGAAMHLVIGVLVVASSAVLPAGWLALAAVLWLAGTVAGIALWRRTVWIPLLASLLVATVWTIGFLTSR